MTDHQPKNTPRASRGFTLVEVLLAFTILAISLGVLFQAGQTGLTVSARAADYAQATQIAQSVLERAGLDLPLTVQDHAGEVRGTPYRWTVKVTPYQEWATQMRVPFDPVLVKVTVLWGEAGRSSQIDLQTVKLRPR